MAKKKKKEKRVKKIKKIPIRKTSKLDKWKFKKEYTVTAPKLFEEKEISNIYTTDEKQLLNRVINYPYSNISSRFDEISTYTTIKMRIIEIKGKKAITRIIGSNLTPAYLKTLARRRRSVINEFRNVITKDNELIKVKTTIITQRRISRKAKTAVRTIIGEHIANKAKNIGLNEFITYVLSNKLSSEIRKDVQKIAPIKKILIHKIEIKNTVV